MEEHIKKQAKRRLSIIEGQVRGLQKMIEGDKYCIDVIVQSQAIKEALSGVEDVVLKGHLSTHVVEQIESGEIDKATKEILKVFRAGRKK